VTVPTFQEIEFAAHRRSGKIDGLDFQRAPIEIPAFPGRKHHVDLSDRRTGWFSLRTCHEKAREVSRALV
jgi:hypothetical protein